jgi:hypothetical protein
MLERREMPVVFVHGTNNRAGDEYWDTEVERNEFLREMGVAGARVVAQGRVHRQPYWVAMVPSSSRGTAPSVEESYKKFGAKGDVDAFRRTVELVAKPQPMESGVVDRARLDFAATVDLLYGLRFQG